MHESWTMTPRTRRAKRMLLTSVGLTAGTLLFSCGRVEGEGPPSADGPFGTGGFVGNPKGCWYDLYASSAARCCIAAAAFESCPEA